MPASRFWEPPKSRDRGFWLGLACAALLHSVVFLGLMRSVTRYLGERDGSPDGVSVDMIGEAEFASLTNEPTTPAFQPPAPEATAQPAPPPAPPPTPSPLRPTVPEQAPAPAPERAAGQKAAEAALLEKELADLLVLPDATGKQGGSERLTKDGPAKDAAAKASPTKAPPTKDANRKDQISKDKSTSLSSLDLTLPSKMRDNQMTFQGTSAATSRPNDITRSGENDDFGRGVIRALRVTMPAPDGSTGRVTIRMLLSDNGNVVELRLVNSSGVPHMDQGVMFAVKQASFPIPPKGATVSDRTFLVTYVYR